MEPLEQGDPRTVGNFRILARIGAGGMAAVYLGRSRGGRAVAVKVMHPELSREAEFRDRFRREVAATTAAGGVHSPPVLGADPDAVPPWMATAFLPSVSLREAVERFGPLPAPTVRRLAAGLAEALAALHRAGVAHLDVNPSNVLLTPEGPRLIDFGIATASPGPAVTGPPAPPARPATPRPPEPPAPSTSAGTSPRPAAHPPARPPAPQPPPPPPPLPGPSRRSTEPARQPTEPARPTEPDRPTDPAHRTEPAEPTRPAPQPAATAGTWGFMSPEQVAGAAGAPSDVYSLGTTLEFALGGRGATDGWGGPDGQRGVTSDRALAALIAECRRPEASDRPTAAGLTARLAGPVRGEERPGASWLPPAGSPWLTPSVLAAIDAKAIAADNPPLPRTPPPSRRLLLAGGIAAGVAAVGGTVFALTRDGTPGARAGQGDGGSTATPGTAAPAASRPATQPPSPTASAPPVKLEFEITGDGPVASLAYAVNGTFTKLKDVGLPWRKTVEVRSVGGYDWRVRFSFGSGKARLRVLADGVEQRDESYPVTFANFPTRYPYDVDTSGAAAVAGPGPLPGANG